MCVLAIDLISMDGTQSRAAINEETIADYTARWEAGLTFPPIKVFHDGKQHWLGDGAHRVLAAKRAKRGSIIAEVEKGTQRDALLYSLGANQEHGLRRTHADKRHLVTVFLNDAEWVKWTDTKIAEHAGVGQPFVSSVRKELISKIGSPAEKAKDEPREGKDGKKRKPPKVKAAKEVKPPKTDGKISGGTSFNTEELEAASAPKPPKNGAAKVEFDDAKCKAAFVSLVKMLDDRWDIMGGTVGHRANATKHLNLSFDAYEKWVKG